MAINKRYLPRDALASLFDALKRAGFAVIGPKVKDGAIVFSELNSVNELPVGWQEEAGPGSYHLTQQDTKRCFSWNTGPQGIKPWLFRPKQSLWRAEQTPDGLRFKEAPINTRPLAFIGVRACDLAALAIQDQHFIEGAYPDPYYRAQRENMLLIAVNCARSADTCFCVSTQDGPEAKRGYDLVLDELDEGLLIAAGSEKGQTILDNISTKKAQSEQIDAATAQINHAKKQQRVLPDESQLMTLLERLDSEQWQKIAERCLACGSCTSVCPTCFCSKQTSLIEPDCVGHQVRLWDSCFSEQHSYAAGRVVRNQISQRYRQWLTHKLVTWQQQFGRSGCVGCGRCIAWCPVGIDLVEEAQTLINEPAQ